MAISAVADGDAVRRVADLDSPRLAGFEIDVVETDRERRDALDVLGHLVDDVLAALLVERDQQRIDVFAVASSSSIVIFGSSPWAITS